MQKNKTTQDTIKEIKRNLLKSPVLHPDETGLRVSGKLMWVHTASNSKYTLLTVRKKRGREGMEAGGILQNYTGRMVHDCFAPYFGFDKAKHSLCVEHLRRELTEQEEQGHVWASDMKALLLEMKKVVDGYKSENKAELSRYYINKFKARYEAVLTCAKQEITPSKTRKKTKAENLLKRLEKYREEITVFTRDFNVPFDNNQAERDIRSVKVKQKVSGCMRTIDGAKDFADTASVIGTVVKLFGHSVVNSVKDIFNGNALAIYSLD